MFGGPLSDLRTDTPKGVSGEITELERRRSASQEVQLSRKYL